MSGGKAKIRQRHAGRCLSSPSVYATETPPVPSSRLPAASAPTCCVLRAPRVDRHHRQPQRRRDLGPPEGGLQPEVKGAVGQPVQHGGVRHHQGGQEEGEGQELQRRAGAGAVGCERTRSWGDGLGWGLSGGGHTRGRAAGRVGVGRDLQVLCTLEGCFGAVGTALRAPGHHHSFAPLLKPWLCMQARGACNPAMLGCRAPMTPTH
jgi:hypothetical protein